MSKINLKLFFENPSNFLAPLADTSPLKSLLLSLGSLKQLWDDFPLGIIVTDSNCNILYYNNTMQKIDSMKGDFVIGKKLNDIYGPCPEPVLTQSCLVTRKSISNFVCVYRTRFGKIVNSSHWVYPLEVEGELLGAICLIQEFDQIRSEIPIISSYDDPLQKLDRRPTLNNMVGHNKQLIAAINAAKAAAMTNSNVLLSGETGVGKEIFAQGIHKSSNRSKEPFIAINCSAIPSSLIESVLFGTVKGTFTGAIDKPGLFESAGSGTLFLDEIDSLTITLQPKLLRVIEEKRVRRVGSNHEYPINAKIISSIGCQPAELISNKKMRLDLFYRLAVVVVIIPPLRMRMDDLDDLCFYFMQKFNYILGKKFNSLSSETKDIFTKYSWPGNIRELEHIIEGAMNIAGNEEILTPNLLPHHFLTLINNTINNTSVIEVHQSRPKTVVPASTKLEKKLLTEVMDKEREIIEQALINTHGRLNLAASSLGISRQVLSYKLKKIGLDRRYYKSN